MGNEFVDYLNSMNNATADNINALAESQVNSVYYDYIMVNRKIGEFISSEIKAGKHRCYIISGYAGDGKTSILVQILKELNLLEKGEGLKIEDTKKVNGINLMYVKDMSELNKDEQKSLLEKSLNAPSNGMSSILISNTGPLINAFKNLFVNDDSEVDEIENLLLKQLDENNNEELEYRNNKFYLINIARIDNLGFVKNVIGKICDDKLWNVCLECENLKKCPLCKNKNFIEKNKIRVVNFIENYYRWLKENDKRITIRQMISQITFAMTGNLKCSDIEKFDENKYNDFIYNFANLFFGYRGVGKIEEAKQIKSINILQDMGLDEKSLDEDYDLFVRNDFSMFDIEVRNVISKVWNDFSNKVYISENEESKRLDDEENLRKSVRRFLLFYSNIDDIKEEEFYEKIYGKAFIEYSKLTTNRATPAELRKVNKNIINAIYIKNLGVEPKGNTLYFTLRKNEDINQNVFLLLAKTDNKKIKIIQESKNIEMEDIDKAYNLDIVIDNKEKFRINFPLLAYFYAIVDGEINTDIDPSLSHGLDKLNSLLINRFREESCEKEMNIVLVDSKNDVKDLTINFSDEEKIIFE